jgi:hypothetical protein
MTGDTLLRRLETEEEQVRTRLQSLRSEVAQLEEQLAHLAITQRTVTKLMADVGSASEDQTHEVETARPAEPFATDTRGTSEAQPHSGRSGVVPLPDQGVTAGSHDKPTLGPVSAKIRLLVCSADRPLTPKDVTHALGRDSTKRARIESVRAALEKLASNGHLAKIGPGLFSAPHTQQEGAA